MILHIIIYWICMNFQKWFSKILIRIWNSIYEHFSTSSFLRVIFFFNSVITITWNFWEFSFIRILFPWKTKCTWFQYHSTQMQGIAYNAAPLANMDSKLAWQWSTDSSPIWVRERLRAPPKHECGPATWPSNGAQPTASLNCRETRGGRGTQLVASPDCGAQPAAHLTREHSKRNRTPSPQAWAAAL